MSDICKHNKNVFLKNIKNGNTKITNYIKLIWDDSNEKNQLTNRKLI
jgi:hypothetical protein